MVYVVYITAAEVEESFTLSFITGDYSAIASSLTMQFTTALTECSHSSLSSSMSSASMLKILSTGDYKRVN
jgi:hypothetical protein